jgi:hypothetical protein
MDVAFQILTDIKSQCNTKAFYFKTATRTIVKMVYKPQYFVSSL